MVLGARQGGWSLVELLIACALSALMFAALAQVAHMATVAQPAMRDSTEALYQGRFALERVRKAAQATAPGSLLTPAANTSGNWFGSSYFCVNGAAQLIETTSADTGCSGSTVIAERVSAFSVALPAGAGGSDGEVADLGITLSGPNGGGSLSLSERVRLGGGTQ